MKKILLIAALLVPLHAHAGEWYEGGTLHESDLLHWQRATMQNRLATASDFTARWAKIVGYDFLDMRDLHDRSSELMYCINGIGYQAPHLGTMPVIDAATLCFQTLGRI